jgi:amino acid transporter
MDTINILTVGKLTPLTILILAGLFYVNPPSFSFGPPPTASAFSNAMLLLVYAYTGFETAMIPGAEITNPRRNHGHEFVQKRAGGIWQIKRS